MRKIGLYFCAGVLMLSLAACGQKGQEDGSQGTGQQESGSLGTEQQESSSQETEESPSQGTEEGQEDAEEPGMDISDGWSQEMESLRQAVIAAVGEENYWPNMPMDPEMLGMSIGVTPEMYEDYMAEVPMISAHVDMLVIIKAKEDQADAVEEILKTYRQGKVDDTMQYPKDLAKIQASQVERVGNYMIFALLGGERGEIIDEGAEEDAIRQCQEANGAAIEAIRGIVESN